MDFKRYALVKFGLKEVVYLAGKKKPNAWHLLASNIEGKEPAWEPYNWSFESFDNSTIEDQESFLEISKEDAFAMLL